MNNHALQAGEKAAFHGMLHLIIIGGLKLIGGILTGITVLIADAISTFSDILGLFASYLGLSLSRKSATKDFEYGYYKTETFATLIVSLSIVYLGYVIARKAANTFFYPEVGEHFPFAVTITVISAYFSYKLYKELYHHGEEINSYSLKANARDKLMDTFAEIGVLISIVANYRGIPYVEGVVTMLIAVFILKEGLISTKNSIFFLLDFWDDPVLLKKIRHVLNLEKDLVVSVKRLRLRRAGTFIFGEAFIEINPFAGLNDLREELDLLSEKIKKLNPYIKDFSIFTHISKSEKLKVAVPIEKGRLLSAKVASTLKRTNAYLFANIKNGKITRFYTKKLKLQDKKPVELANFLNAEKIQILIDNNLDSLIYYNLRRIHHILIYPNFADVRKVESTLKLLLIDT